MSEKGAKLKIEKISKENIIEKENQEEKSAKIFKEDKERQRWPEIVEDKIRELYTEGKVPLRFLNKEELFRFLKNKKVFSVEVARYAGDIQKFVDEGREFGWSHVAHVLTNWKPQVGQPEFYSTLVKEFFECCRKAKKLAKERKIDKEKIRETALKEFEKILQDPEKKISKYYSPYVKKSIENASRILNHVSLIRGDIKFLKNKGENFSGEVEEELEEFEEMLKKVRFTDTTKEFLQELLKEKVYPLDEKNFRDILLKYSSLSSPRPYQAIMFIRESVFEPSKEYGFDWGWIKKPASLESALLGILAMIPDKKFLNEIKTKMLKETENKLENRVPIYDWRGNLVWPTRMKPEEIEKWLKQNQEEKI